MAIRRCHYAIWPHLTGNNWPVMRHEPWWQLARFRKKVQTSVGIRSDFAILTVLFSWNQFHSFEIAGLHNIQVFALRILFIFPPSHFQYNWFNFNRSVVVLLPHSCTYMCYLLAHKLTVSFLTHLLKVQPCLNSSNFIFKMIPRFEEVVVRC